MTFSRKIFLLLFGLVALIPSARVEGQAARAEPIRWQGWDAFRLSDGHSEAIIVPTIGRLMHYGPVGGENLLWNSGEGKRDTPGFHNWGGDKTFVGPHAQWGLFQNSLWPPPPEWDGPPQTAEVLPDGSLRMVGAVWPGFETRITRRYALEPGGDLVIEQTLEKLSGPPLFLSIWQVAQAIPPEAVFFRPNPASAYRDGVHWFGAAPKNGIAQTLSPTLLRIVPPEGVSFKIGLDSPVAALVAVKNGLAWCQRTEKLAGKYPDGAEGAGFPVEFYNHNAAGLGHYVELELLSPLWKFSAGTAKTQVLHWSLHPLPAGDPTSAEAMAEVTKLLAAPR